MALDAEVLLLDDLGAHRVTEWVEDTVTSIITYRCNNRKPLIATTNLADPDAGGAPTPTVRPDARKNRVPHHAGRPYRFPGPLASIRDVQGRPHAPGGRFPSAQVAIGVMRALLLLLIRPFWRPWKRLAPRCRR